MLLMLMNVTSNPMEGIRQQIQDQKLVSKFCNLLQETNQAGNVKGVSRIHACNVLIMEIAWSGKARGLIPCGYLKFILHSYRSISFPMNVDMNLITRTSEDWWS